MAGLQVEKADHQRAGQTEQRGGETGRHATQRQFQLLLEGAEHAQGIVAHVQRADDVGHRPDGDQQTPEGAEQAEENGQSDQIARQVA